jgi:hypothetical protein
MKGVSSKFNVCIRQIVSGSDVATDEKGEFN